MRIDKRRADEMREVFLERRVQKFPAGSALIEVGNTKVLCAATIEDKVPAFLKGTGTGWLSAEYSMLPGATTERNPRERSKIGGRTAEIQRLIGRALRSVTDLEALGERSIIIDCDVLQADGGTRTASITAAFVALVEACETIYEVGGVFPVKDFVAAISAGISTDGENLLDLCYAEDKAAAADCNVVMTGAGELVEVQITAEKNPFTRPQLNALLDLAEGGINELISLQKDALGRELVWRVGRVG
ncbi:MAG: ribonuclease PH [Selenomonadaceae bacterium]|nr:ribonuclease PH [Selenomonadaceae bacterium]MBQ4403916.1 ribonuclease PH [Selenomonadaceae bacterium]MBQ6131392.1 ribonuclease PH [Selenomonadaceae bacterium]MBQ7494117.1 ribonuclease PH [Selenomonadaceae bacterium]